MVTEINHTEASGMLGTTLGLEKGGEGSCFDSSPYSRVTPQVIYLSEAALCIIVVLTLPGWSLRVLGGDKKLDVQ